MFHVRQISSLDLPELAPYRTLRRAAEHETQGIFVAEGDKVVRRLLESHFGVVSVLLPENRVAEFEPLLKSRPEKEIPVFAVTKKSVLEELVGFDLYQGVLAVGKIPGIVTLEKILAAGPGPKLFAAVEGLTSAENTGLLVRNCAAFGAQGLIIGETSSSPFLRRAVRNSMGTIFQLPVVHSKNLITDLDKLRANGVHIIAAHPHTDKKNLSQTDFKKDCCIVFGSEGSGLSKSVFAACDEAVAILMADGVDSLNVGAAAAVFLYEAQRQRGH
ncbi:MAG TPA: RNA methyltransferase [Candidatus Sulfotelmatobacter sp.]|nr:RNA methyltransferase [Candidatus Sulfotelmatobacter sp.]